MPKRDLIYTFAVSLIVGVFLTSLIKSLGILNSLPSVLIYFLVIFVPVIAVVGMSIAYLLGKKIAILWQISKFALVGVSNTAIDFGIFNLLILLTGTTAGTNIIPMKAFSFSGAVVNSYFWNRRWVFEGAKHADFVVFFIVTALGIAINASVVFVITTFIPPIIVKDKILWANVANALATGVSMIWNYLGYKLVVFKK